MRDLFRFLFRIRNTLFFLLLMGLCVAWSITGNEHHKASALRSASDLVGGIYSWRNAITSYADLREVNERLSLENARLKDLDQHAYVPVAEKWVRIDDTLHQQRYTYLAAHVINGTSHRQRNSLTLDKGSLVGVAPDMGVVGVDGIAGVVTKVGPHFSVALSVLDPDWNTSVLIERTGHRGLLQWDTGDPRTASVVDIAKHAPVRPGDTVVTRGNDGIFPSGVPVGVVIDVTDAPGSNYHTITIRLAEDLTRDGPVKIVRDLFRAELDSLDHSADMP
ncbi:MAG: rod shape-determining protein MreC [Flavobacteriales bacterium]|nr:rod shape-determining protein MreC [Flavobacteriales bacterium]MCB9193379.1 rod shape-determining protein MreC [Flavobacteriales bacterium]